MDDRNAHIASNMETPYQYEEKEKSHHERYHLNEGGGIRSSNPSMEEVEEEEMDSCSDDNFQENMLAADPDPAEKDIGDTIHSCSIRKNVNWQAADLVVSKSSDHHSCSRCCYYCHSYC